MPQGSHARIELKPAEKRALDALISGHVGQLTRGVYQELTGMSRSQAAYDLTNLVEAGILARVGSGRATCYRLAGQPSAAQRRWTTRRIKLELGRFCDGRDVWPSAHEFKAAGRWDLYVAASRYGGIRFWAAELGFPRAQAEPPRPSPRVRRTLSWATAGALAGAVAAASIAVVWPHRSGHAGAPQPSPRVIVERMIVQARPAAKRVASNPTARRVNSRRPDRATRRVRPAARAMLVSRTVPPARSAASAASAPIQRAVSSPRPSLNVTAAPPGPTPLLAPRSSAGPSPLPAP
jgi:hypothetical protein